MWIKGEKNKVNANDLHRVILIGDQSVGKSKLMECLLNIESKVNDK